MIEYIKGDLIKAFKENEKAVLVHQCNLTVGMGAGIAKVIADNFPEILEPDIKIRTKALERPEQCLGNTVLYHLGGQKVIANVYSQYFPGNPNKVFDTFEQRLHWLKLALEKFVYIYADSGITFYMPLIASGLAKQQNKKCYSDFDYFKKFIAPTIEEELKDFNVKVYYL